jgi:hypothetical protein
VRVSPDDGSPLRETVVEFYQVLKIGARELPKYHLKRPRGVPPDQEVSLYGGSALVFDEYGRLKYHIRNSIKDVERQQARLDYLSQYGFLGPGSEARRRISAMHLRRGMGTYLKPEKERW